VNVPPTKESGKVSMEAFSMLNERYSNALVTIRELQAERDALREALTKADKQLGAAPVLNAYSAGAWQTIRAALERTP
jgi:hypothetical protein